MDKEIGFKKRAAKAASDPSIAARFSMPARRHGATRKIRIEELGNFEELRNKINKIKDRVLQDHDQLIDELRRQVESLGGVVHLAQDANEARHISLSIAEKAGAKIVVKSKSMTSEEIALTPALEQRGIEVFETDLGEFIIQLAEEPPSHIVLPAIHKTKRDIAKLFSEKLGMDFSENAELLTMKAREVLREKFLKADLGITGGNAVVAENGTLVLFENEGNIRMGTTLPRVHMAIVGTEKIVPSMTDLAALMRLLPRSATGQRMSAYLSFIRGPRRKDERDGAAEFHLILLDNGRSRMRKDPLLREALKCIRCGACLNACPVYQHIGGHTYGSVYPGPIGAMITGMLTGGEDSWMLPFASSLCGACDEVCPAGIPIHDILVELRYRSKNKNSMLEKTAFSLWAEAWSSEVGFRMTGKAAKLLRLLAPVGENIDRLPWPGNAWTNERSFPAPAKRSFHEAWDGHVPQKTRTGHICKSPSSETGSDNEIKNTCMENESRPRSGDPKKFAEIISSSHAEVIVAEGPDDARSKLEKILLEFKGTQIVHWSHPDFDALGLNEVAASAGVVISSGEPDPLDDRALQNAAAQASAGITSADWALAEEGTLVMFNAPGRERSISLLPETHIAVVRSENILRNVEDLFDAAKTTFTEDFRGATFVSSPSLTSDIELILVKGVHGPKRLIVLLISGLERHDGV